MNRLGLILDAWMMVPGWVMGTSQPKEMNCDLEVMLDHLARVPAMLAKRGSSAADIEKVMHGNWLRLLRKAWS